nr:uncharacterized protein LOC117280486 [Nicotiana tomentosiformis]
MVSSHTTLIKQIENQLGDISSQLNVRPRGALSGDIVVNPKGNDGIGHVFAITTRSDVIDIPPKGNEVIKEATKEASKSYKKLPRPPPPYLQRFSKQQKEGQLQKFYDMLNQIIVTVPFVEALEKMPGYAKFMKDLVTMKKNRQSDTSVQCNHFTNQNENDGGSGFIIPCTIGVTSCARAHNGRLGVFNLMPYAVLKIFDLGNPRPTSMKLLMADRTLKHPFGVIDVILVNVGNLYFPDDFVIMDCEEDREVPIILGRPFFATGRVI